HAASRAIGKTAYCAGRASDRPVEEEARASCLLFPHPVLSRKRGRVIDLPSPACGGGGDSRTPALPDLAPASFPSRPRYRRVIRGGVIRSPWVDRLHGDLSLTLNTPFANASPVIGSAGRREDSLP